MLARLQRRLLAVEFLLHLLLALAWWLATDAPGWIVPTIVLLLALSGRAIYVGAAFAIAAATDPERAWPRPLPFARVFIGELVAFTLTHSLLQPAKPFTRHLAPAFAESGPSLLFVHGYCCNAEFWLPLRRRLARAGYRCQRAVDLEPVFADIDTLAERLHERIEALAATDPDPRLVLIAHSMGGLVARAYLGAYGTSRLAGLITLGTPHAGTTLARLAPGPNGRQMRAASAWLAALPQAPAHLPSLHLASPADELVSPAHSALAAPGDGQWLPACGHLALAHRADTVRRIADWLEALHAPTDGEEALHVSVARSGQTPGH
ncbi:alpha/beta fold hydrolase [Spiribacter halobius]|uniref:alpha/beta fold hydrolase n=1 Tax=Sediminicurvatus halobius TaxID=2182432 RepID=UPI001304D6F1|nr:alpha/beta fold hydrolase [Spiribacter halobius]UEX79466.1 alpha/beta fold hydrolase [Spiribacter halobius]